MKQILVIGGLDPGAGAGITADVKTAAAHGVHALTVVTSVTAQDAGGLRAAMPVPPELLLEELRSAVRDVPVAAVKIGMLGDAATVRTVAAFLREHDLGPVVVDPVLRASAGGSLLDGEGRQLLTEELLPLAALVTPNLAEAAALCGFPVDDRAAMEKAGRAIVERFGCGAVVKGGHLPGAPFDLVCVPGQAPHWLPGERRMHREVHGTGCAFSTALACRLAEGLASVAAAQAAKRYLAAAIAGAESATHDPDAPRRLRFFPHS